MHNLSIDVDSGPGTRRDMFYGNKLKLGFFGANCSSGRFVTRAPERWSGSWDDNLELAVAADDAGIDFLLPIARWKGYGGDTDYQGATFETITWATGLLAATRRVTVFGTVHAPLFPPLIAAKQMVTADHVGHGRFGLNVVCGWNEGEFDMFGVAGEDHAARYRQGGEWLEAVGRAWVEDDFDFESEYFHLRGVREKPKPHGGTRPLIMNAGRSVDGQAFALRYADAWFTSALVSPAGDFSEAAKDVAEAKAGARRQRRAIDVFTVAVVVCRPTAVEAQEYFRHITVEMADWGAIDNIMAIRGLVDLPPEEHAKVRAGLANGLGGLPLIGSPDDVANGLIALSEAGFDGCGLSLVNFTAELPYLRQELLPRLAQAGLRRHPD